MSQPVVWEGSVFAKSLAEALAEEASSQPEEARQSLETVVPPDAAAARLLIGLGPQCEDELKDEMVESESPSSEDWGGRWVAAVRGLTRSTARGVTIQAYVRQCKQLVQVSKFGSRAGQDLVVSASAVGAHGSTPGALPGDNSQNNNMQLASGREQDWLDHGMLAGGAGYLLTAAAAAVVPLRLLDSDRPRLAAAVGLTSLPVLALAACRLHGKTADARLTLLLQRNCDALGHSIDCVTTCANAEWLACFASTCTLTLNCAPRAECSKLRSGLFAQSRRSNCWHAVTTWCLAQPTPSHRLVDSNDAIENAAAKSACLHQHRCVLLDKRSHQIA